MAAWHKVATTSQITPGAALCVDVAGHVIALFNLDGELFALADECPHAQGPLSEGLVEGDEVECPWHAARFNIRTGAVCCEPAYEDARTYPVRVVGDDVEVEV